MIAHLRALQGILQTETGWATFLFQGPIDSPVQALVLQAPASGEYGELPVCGADSMLQSPIRLLARGLTGESVGMMLKKSQEVLSPLKIATRFEVTDRVATMKWIRGEFITADPDVTMPETNRNPFWGIDTYELISQPKGP